MGVLAAKLAERTRTSVRLNLLELNAILAAAAPSRRESPDLQRARTRLERARDRRRKAVARAAR